MDLLSRIKGICLPDLGVTVSLAIVVLSALHVEKKVENSKVESGGKKKSLMNSENKAAGPEQSNSWKKCNSQSYLCANIPFLVTDPTKVPTEHFYTICLIPFSLTRILFVCGRSPKSRLSAPV